VYFRQLICLGWFQTMILWISALWIARITDAWLLNVFVNKYLPMSSLTCLGYIAKARSNWWWKDMTVFKSLMHMVTSLGEDSSKLSPGDGYLGDSADLYTQV
jgi:hypothetical protein